MIAAAAVLQLPAHHHLVIMSRYTCHIAPVLPGLWSLP